MLSDSLRLEEFEAQGRLSWCPARKGHLPPPSPSSQGTPPPTKMLPLLRLAPPFHLVHLARTQGELAELRRSPRSETHGCGFQSSLRWPRGCPCAASCSALARPHHHQSSERGGSAGTLTLSFGTSSCLAVQTITQQRLLEAYWKCRISGSPETHYLEFYKILK